MKIRRFLLARLYRAPEPGDEGTGTDLTPAAPAPAPAPAADPAAAPAIAPAPSPEPAGEAPAGTPAPAVDPNAPKTMLEAITAGLDGKKPDAVDPAKEGEKKPKEGEEPAADAAKPPAKEDVTVMPEGLAPKAQERFRALVTANKEIQQQVEGLREQTEYVGTQFRQNGITQPQFELAVGLIGAMNRGDWPTVIKGMQEQMRQVALLSGQHIDGIDMLSGMPDLRERVENLQLSREDAAELARGRTVQQMTQRQRAEQAQAEREQQAEQVHQQRDAQARQQAVAAVDQLCSDLKRSDLDFARIEAALLPRVGELFAHLPPSQWPAAFKSQYDLMKSMGAPARGNSAGTLRAGGADNPVASPKNMYQAMFGESRP